MQRLCLCLAMMFLTACNRAPDGPPPEPPRVVVCATVYPLASVVREVGGDLVRVDWILDLGDPIQFFQATAAERGRMTGVDLLVCDGLRSETWAAQVIGSLDDAKKVLALDRMPVVNTTPSTGFLWLDPIVVREAVGPLTEHLGDRRPRQRDFFRAQAKAFTDKLDAILKAHPNSAFGRSRVMVASNQLDALLDRFGIGAVLVDIDPLRLEEADFRRIREVARREGLQSILLPFDTPPGTIADLEARTGLTGYRIDELGLPQYAEHSSYLEILSYNLAQLQAATR